MDWNGDGHIDGADGALFEMMNSGGGNEGGSGSGEGCGCLIWLTLAYFVYLLFFKP